MPGRTTLNVSLTPELEKFVQTRVATGRYQTASEVVREGLRLLEIQEREREQAFKSLKSRLRKASQAKSEDFIDGEAYLEQVMKRLVRQAKRPA
jgi:antitoxin ParD1/3/4